jgi:hypothetical protein
MLAHDIAAMIPHAASRDTNPLRKQGCKLLASLALRVSIRCLIGGRVRYIHTVNQAPWGQGAMRPDEIAQRMVASSTIQSLAQGLFG